MLPLEHVAQSDAPTKTKGLPRPDLSIPRNAWFFVSLKNGTHFSSITKDENYERVDPVNLLSDRFPPTFFVRDKADGMVLSEISLRAHEKLQHFNIETGILLPEDISWIRRWSGTGGSWVGDHQRILAVVCFFCFFMPRSRSK